MTAAPVRAGSVRIARLDPRLREGVTNWTPVDGVSGLTFSPVLEDALDAYAGLQALPRAATVTVAFRPTRAMVRLLFGWAAAADRTAIRSATRRRALARRRRAR